MEETRFEVYTRETNELILSAEFVSEANRKFTGELRNVSGEAEELLRQLLRKPRQVTNAPGLPITGGVYPNNLAWVQSVISSTAKMLDGALVIRSPEGTLDMREALGRNQ